MPNSSISAQDILTITLARLFQKLPRMENPSQERTLGVQAIANKDPRLMQVMAQLDVGDMMVIAEKLKGNHILHELGLNLSFDRSTNAFTLQPATSIVTVNLP